jgi:hypothetical protein
MPDLNFQVTGVEAVARGMTPLLHFKIAAANSPPEQAVQAVLLNAQVQIQCPQRGYNAHEKENLVELFGPPEAWGQTLRNRLWAHANTTLGAFTGRTETVLPVVCTYDLNIASTRYFYGLEGGEVPLLFLFSGSVFYSTPEGCLQVSPISWNTECIYRMPVEVWRSLMERIYPNTSWLSLRRDAFDRLCAYKRRRGIVTWEETVERLLENEREEAGRRVNEAESEEVTA